MLPDRCAPVLPMEIAPKFFDPRKPRREVQVILREDDPHTYATIEVEGDTKLASTVLERETTPIDLDIAMKSPPMREFAPELLEGFNSA